MEFWPSWSLAERPLRFEELERPGFVGMPPGQVLENAAGLGIDLCGRTFIAQGNAPSFSRMDAAGASCLISKDWARVF
ncbi:hypothetical protein Pyn_40508 [Prunus yedoensis var. nudiflora]|uniref:Uncharacterized protein n=1 Tax=Prunus yedoensis var. nudiflora TaxID=2094558 RepID=A0A314UCR9_PRUYE|nr:hypothetical protein Pyn_40508 [Prunus yedoensis var. nudiflora]